MSHENTLSRVEAELITSLPACEALRHDWIDLWERAPEAGVFQRPEWLVPWWRHFGSDKRMRVVALRVARRLVGLLPLAILDQPDNSRELQLIGTGNTDRLDAIVDPAFRADAVNAWSGWLNEQCDEWDRCLFAQIPRGSVLLGLRAPAGMNRTEIPAEPCPVLHLSAAESGAPRNAGSRRHAYYLRRAQREGVHFIETSSKDLHEFLDALFALHAQRWHEREQPGVLSDPAVQAFLHEACNELAGVGMLRITALEQHNRYVALYLGFSARGRTSAYIGGFDPEYKRINPGTLLLGRIIEEARREQGEVDFLRGREQYKYDWGASNEMLFTCIFHRGTL